MTIDTPRLWLTFKKCLFVNEIDHTMHEGMALYNAPADLLTNLESRFEGFVGLHELEWLLFKESLQKVHIICSLW